MLCVTMWETWGLLLFVQGIIKAPLKGARFPASPFLTHCSDIHSSRNQKVSNVLQHVQMSHTAWANWEERFGSCECFLLAASQAGSSGRALSGKAALCSHYQLQQQGDEDMLITTGRQAHFPSLLMLHCYETPCAGANVPLHVLG